MNYALFLLLNALLFLRPEDLIPGLAGTRLYLIAILACTAASLPGLAVRLTPSGLRAQPVTICVLGFWAAGFLSFVGRGKPLEGVAYLTEMVRWPLYFLLLIVAIDRPARFRGLLAVVIACVAVGSALSVAQYEGAVDFPTLEPVLDRHFNPATGEEDEVRRLRGAGFMNDPNDVCLVLIFASLGCLYLSATTAGARRWLWLIPVGLFAYAFILTHSRGGLLGLLAGAGGWLWIRHGAGRSAALVLGLIPVLLVVVGGRQSDISGGGTAHERLMVWAEGLQELLQSPALIPTGLGFGYCEETVGLVAHNSFATAYIEFGVIGGGFFLAAFYHALRGTFEVRDAEPPPGLGRPAAAFVFAALAAYATGVFSLSRNFVEMTYLVLGVGAAYLQMVGREPAPVGTAWAVRMGVLFVAGFVGLKLVTQILSASGV